MSGKALRGYLDRPRDRELIGWVWDPARPAERLLVEFSIDGAPPLRRRKASAFRPDLEALGIGDGRHAFSFELPRTVFDGEPHTLSTTVDGVHIEASPMDFQSVYSGTLMGSLESGIIRGTLRDDARPEARALWAEVYGDGRFLGSALAQTDARFEIHVPESLDFLKIQSYELRARGCSRVVARAIAEKAGEPVDIIHRMRVALCASPADEDEFMRRVTPLLLQSMQLQSNPDQAPRLRPPDDPAAKPITGKSLNQAAPVDVVVRVDPVHGITPALRTLESIGQSTSECPHTVTVLLGDHVRDAAMRGAIEETAMRLGFGMAGQFSPTRDFVLLDSNTYVSGDWLDRLRKAAYSDARTASASPCIGSGVAPRARHDLLACTHADAIAAIPEPSTICAYYVLLGYSRPQWEPGWRHVRAQDVYVDCLTAPPIEEPPALITITTMVNASPDIEGRYHVHVNDNSWICPRVDLIDETGSYCGEPVIEACERCFHKLGPRSDWGSLLLRAGSVAELRAQHKHVLENAETVHFHSQQFADRIARYAQVKRAVIANHPPQAPASPMPVARTEPSAPPRQKSNTVDIIMPVYAGVPETLAAIEAVLAADGNQPYELIAILDNPNNAEMADALRPLSPRVTVLHNESNLGFPATANRGMQLHPDRDVLLLNSDTVVPQGDWLDRMRAAAYRDPRNGTVTPFSNNATICSYPRFCRDNSIDAALDGLCQNVLAGRTVEIPTAVGFCMYMRRDCLHESGYFDAATFGRGYGEENDFCMRASKLGWRHVLAADVFVGHHGRVSFQLETSALTAHGAEQLRTLHPEYETRVAAFLAADPILPMRRQLDLERLPQGAVYHCIATNALPGGTERHAQENASRARDAGKPVVFMRYRNGREIALESVDAFAGPCDNFRYTLPEDREDLLRALRKLGVERIHIHQIVDAPPGIFDLGIPYDITVLDYGWICPQVTLQDQTGSYCGEPSIAACERCYRDKGTHKDWKSLRVWAPSVKELRRQGIAFLEAAGTVFCPSHDVAERTAKYAKLPPVLFQPLDSVTGPAPRRPRRKEGERVRVVYIGSLGYAKGYHGFYQCALDASKRALPLDFVVLGGTADNEPLLDLGVRIVGPYDEDEVRTLLEELTPHVALFPATWPETYSYTLSIAFVAGLWPVAYDLGAIRERVLATGFGKLVPLGTPAGILNEVLLAEA